MPVTNQSTFEPPASLALNHPEAAALLRGSGAGEPAAGYEHTLREILQQPETWLDTGARLVNNAALVGDVLGGMRSIVLTGSGSSEFAGECVRAGLQKRLSLDCHSLAGGTILTYGLDVMPPARPCLMVSFARSGDSPESTGAVDLVLDTAVGTRQLVITCNESGRLATAYQDDERVRTVVLDSRTNDQSLAMTSSFTNLALGATFLGFLKNPDEYKKLCARLSLACSGLLEQHLGTLARVAGGPFRRAVYLGSGPRFGAAREAALKMLEMTAGRVPTMAESYLGLRHGPMSFVHADTLVVCFLSSDPLLRAYESDLIAELNEKELGWSKLLIGEAIPSGLLRAGDTALELRELKDVGDDDSAILHVVAGQLLAFFRCLAEGLKPDSPSDEGVINRVVNKFTIHRTPEQVKP